MLSYPWVGECTHTVDLRRGTVRPTPLLGRPRQEPDAVKELLECSKRTGKL